MTFGSNRDFFHTGLQVGRSDIRAMMDGMGPGDHFFVDYRNGADGNDGQTWEKALRTYSEAIDRVQSNHNDVIHIDGDSEVLEPGMVTVSKNRVHTIGHNGVLGHYGPGARIGMSAAVADYATIRNTGVRNTFTGIKISSGGSTTGYWALWEAGEYGRYFNCEVQKTNVFNVTTAGDLKLTGDSPQFYNCSIGVSSIETVGAIIRPNVYIPSLGSGTGERVRDGYFQDCIFPKMTGNAAARFVYVDGDAIERWLIFNNCIFITHKLSTAEPTFGIGASVAQTIGRVLCKDCVWLLPGQSLEDAMGFYETGAVPTIDATGIPVTT